jgi:hypothetical protein
LLNAVVRFSSLHNIPTDQIEDSQPVTSIARIPGKQTISLNDMFYKLSQLRKYALISYQLSLRLSTEVTTFQQSTVRAFAHKSLSQQFSESIAIVAKVCNNAIIALAPNFQSPLMPTERLSQHPASWVRTAVASNVYTAPELLRALCHDENISVRLAAAFNSSCPIECLEELAKSTEWEIRLGLVSQLDLCEEILVALTKHRNPYLVNQAELALTALEMERRLEKAQIRPAGSDNFKIGTLLVDANLITLTELQKALTCSQKHNIKIGRTLLQVGLVSSDSLFQALSLQTQLRSDEISIAKALSILSNRKSKKKES